MAFIWMNLPATRKGGRLANIDFLGAGLLSVATITLLLALVWRAGSRALDVAVAPVPP